MASESFLKLYEITKKLRSKDGCPWDKKQTPLTLRETFIEETFEAIEKYGLLKGIFLGFIRILKCNPFSKGGYDPLK